MIFRVGADQEVGGILNGEYFKFQEKECLTYKDTVIQYKNCKLNRLEPLRTQ